MDMCNCLRKITTFISLFFLINISVWGADISWTGAGGDSLWSNSSNWSSGTVPTSSDRVFIYSNTNSINISLSGLTSINGTIYFYGNNTITVDLAGATITSTSIYFGSSSAGSPNNILANDLIFTTSTGTGNLSITAVNASSWNDGSGSATENNITIDNDVSLSVETFYDCRLKDKGGTNINGNGAISINAVGFSSASENDHAAGSEIKVSQTITLTGDAADSVTTPINTWLGNSTDWNDDSNWSYGTAPSITDSIKIPAGCTNYPETAASISVDKIEIEAGATLTFTGALIDLSTQTWSGTGEIIFAGTSNQSFKAPSATIGKITNNCAGDLSIDSEINATTFVNNRKLKLSSGCTSFTATTKTNGTGSTVIYDGATTLLWGTDYVNIEFTGSAQVSGDDIFVSGNWTDSTTTSGYSAGTSTITFTGSPTLTGSTSFYNLSATGAGGKTITLANDITVTNTLSLSGTSASNLLTVSGNGNGFKLSSSQSGSYINIVDTKIKDTSGNTDGVGSIYFEASDSKYNNANDTTSKLSALNDGWRLQALTDFDYTWNGSDAGNPTDWATASNWTPALVPGITSTTENVKVIIPGSLTKYPITAATYQIGDLEIETGASITLGASDITIATGSSLENHGTIVYTDTGRIKQETTGTVLNDTNGTVEYAAGSGTISPVAYGNLKISSGTWEWATASASPSPSVVNLTATGGTFKITAPFDCVNAIDLSATSVELRSTLSSNGTITIKDVTVNNASSISASTLKIADGSTLSTTSDGSITTTSDLETLGALENNITLYAEKNVTAGGNITGFGVLVFNGSDAQILTTNSKEISSVEENKSTTAGSLTITGDCKITTFTITQGKNTVFTGTPQITTISDAATAGNIKFTNGTTVTNVVTFNTTGELSLQNTNHFNDLIHTDGKTIVNGTLNAASVTFGSAGSTNTITFTGSIITTGNQIYHGAISGASMNFTSTDLTINNTLTSTDSVTISNSGTLSINDITNPTDTNNFDITCLSFTQSGTGSVSISGDIKTSSTTGDFSFASPITLIGNVLLKSAKDITINTSVSDTASATNNLIFEAANISLNDNVSTGGSININNTGVFKSADGKNISFGTAFSQTGTGQNMIGGSFTGNATATFATDVYLFGAGTSSAIGTSGQTITCSKNLIVAKTSTTADVKLNAQITCENFVLYGGSTTLNQNLSTSLDCILLGSNYSEKDEQTGLPNIYTYTEKPTGWKTPSYNTTAASVWETAFPDTTVTWPTWSGPAFAGKLTVADGITLKVGTNFYANGLTLSGTPAAANWYIEIHDNTNSANCFAEAYNTNVSNSTVICSDDNSTDGSKSQIVFEPGVHGCTCASSCENWDSSSFEITQAYTRRDNAIFIELNKTMRTNESKSKLSYITTNDSLTSPPYADLYTDTDPDCQTVLTSDAASFYYKSSQTWNTDATGNSVGATGSTDHTGTPQTLIPSIKIPRSTADNHYIITDKFGKRLKNYSNGHEYTAVEDKTGPVLYSVRTGQENHTQYNSASGAASQPSYDAHNFIEFRYSEPVDFNGGTIAPTDQNIQVNDTFGAITNSSLTETSNLEFAGLGTIANGCIQTGSTDAGVNARYVNALYRTDAHSIRISIAGYTNGTVTDRNGHAYKKWIGYIEQAVTPSGTVTMFKNSGNFNSLITDHNHNQQEEYAGNQQTIPTVDSTTSSVYGKWDTSEPVFAPLRLKATNTWETPNSDSFYESVGNTSGSGSTLDRIEFHLYDNKPDYSSGHPYEWITEIGWCQNGNTTLFSPSSYCADVFGGARPFTTSDATTGGIRASSLINASSAFKYTDSQTAGVTPNKSFTSGTSGVYIGATAPLFTGSSANRRSANLQDGLYFGLQLTESNLPITQAFTITYDDSTGYITDLAGNRLKSATIKTIDRTPPSFDFTVAPISKNELFIMFAKELSTNSDILTYHENDGTTTTIPGTFETFIPKCFELFTLDNSGTPSTSTSLQIDDSKPAVISHYQNNSNGQGFTGIKLTLTNDITLEDLTKLYVKIINPSEVSATRQDPITGIAGLKVTFIQDLSGNFIPLYTAHTLSDFAINAVNPLYAYDIDFENSIVQHDDSERTWTVQDWNADQHNYGTLTANHQYEMILDLNDGTEAKHNLPKAARMFVSPSPAENSISNQINSDLNSNLRIWIPNINNADFSFISKHTNPVSNYLQLDSTKLDDSMPERHNISISKTISEQWGANQQVKFLFGLLDPSDQLISIYNSLFYDVTTDRYDFSQSNKIPLLSLRLLNPQDFTSLDLWSFITRNVTEQRGGVSILNNVINAEDGEKTILKINMPSTGKLNIMIMTIDGNIVTYLNHGEISAGEHNFTWNGRNANGNLVARGMYFIRIIGSGFDETRKVIVIK